MDETRCIRIVIDLELGSDPIAGRVAGVGDGDPEPDRERTFVGWLALVRELERASQTPAHEPHGE